MAIIMSILLNLSDAIGSEYEEKNNFLERRQGRHAEKSHVDLVNTT